MFDIKSNFKIGKCITNLGGKTTISLLTSKRERENTLYFGVA